MSYSECNKVLRKWLEMMYGKHFAKVWIKKPKIELFEYLSCLENKDCLEALRRAVRQKLDMKRLDNKRELR